MNHSETFALVAAALARAQGAFPLIPRDRTVKVNLKPKADGRDGGSYTFAYAPLETILDKTRGPLSANELALVQAVMLDDDGKGGAVEVLRTTLIHSSGEWLSNDVPMFIGTGDNKSQAYNSGTTYARRAGVTLLLCIAADEDDDGNGGEQDGPRPDYERAETPAYRGRFPKQGGGYSKPPAERGAPAAPKERPSAGPGAFEDLEDPSLFEKPAAVAGAAVFADDLTDGQISLVQARLKAAKLDEAHLVSTYGVLNAGNINGALRDLKAAANAAG